MAFQVGSEVSYNELGQIVGLDNETIGKYIQLFEKAFIIFRLETLNRNLRNELKKQRNIYIFDNGIRNAVINSFNPFNSRLDKGALWKNFLISERWKFIHYERIFANKCFWRTHQQQEIDYIEEYDGKMNAYEFKWSSEKNVRFPKIFPKAYPECATNIIHN